MLLLTVLAPAGTLIRVLGSGGLLFVLPGVWWAQTLLPAEARLLRWTTTVALSYSITSLSILLLSYLPGPVQPWMLLLAVVGIGLLPLVWGHPSPGDTTNIPSALLVILGVALLLRGANLHYSEFQGDEALAMLSAAEALAGHEDALFIRSKGPGEVLLPLALWLLTGTITEWVARLPFLIAAMGAIVTLYLIAMQLDSSAAWVAAGFLAFNGFMVAFGRIVQYQALVVWFSGLAFLFMLRWSQTGRRWDALLAGAWLGLGFLAHYDAILVLPALGWLVAVRCWQLRHVNALISAGLAGGAFLLVTLPYYLPFLLDPRVGQTGDYVGGRIGNELRNNLPDFFHFNTFYSSFYYLMLTSLLVLGLLMWWLWRAGRLPRWSAMPLVAGCVAVSLYPPLLGTGGLDLSVLPFALMLLAAFLVAREAASQAVIVWLAVPFLGYNFVVALGLTHIYTIVPAWSLLAGLAWTQLFAGRPRLSHTLLGGLAVVMTVFLANAFIRWDVAYWQDYPAGHLTAFWTPYEHLPPAGFFGFVHRAGWKATGQQLQAVPGDYGSNEEPDVTTWYMRGAPRACDPLPEFYLLADDLIDPVDVPGDIIAARYAEVGRVPGRQPMHIMQQTPTTLNFDTLDEAALTQAFDASATPDAFARSARGAIPRTENFGHLVQLTGYDLSTERSYPGGRVPVTLYWQALADMPTGYQVFVHLVGEGLVTQSDGVPVCWTYPTDQWRPGQLIADQHALALPAEVAPGTYRIEVGLYAPETFQRLDVMDLAGNPAGTHITLTEIQIAP